MIKERFNVHALEQLNEDELSLLYLLYNTLFDREHVNLQSVFVGPVLKRITNTTVLNEEGCKVRDSIVSKLESFYS